MAQFELLGYYKDYFVDGKYTGSVSYIEKDREVYGYNGRQKDVLKEDVICTNKKKIKAGTEVVTEIFPLNGKQIPNT